MFSLSAQFTSFTHMHNSHGEPTHLEKVSSRLDSSFNHTREHFLHDRICKLAAASVCLVKAMLFCLGQAILSLEAIIPTIRVTVNPRYLESTRAEAGLEMDHACAQLPLAIPMTAKCYCRNRACAKAAACPALRALP